MTINDEILILANQLANNGNKPTVALIKAKLNKKVPLPVIISTLKTWQHEPSFITLSENQPSNNEKEPEQSTIITSYSDHALHTELACMKKEILELKVLVKQLINQQEK
jgi:hypothetical protein